MRFFQFIYNRWMILIGTALFLISCATTQMGEEHNGFVSLFDSETLNGWHFVPQDCKSDWSVENGMIVGEGSADRLAYLVWNEIYLTDFELQFKYRLPEEGNTGVEIRSQPDPSGKRPFIGYHADLGHVGIGKNVLGAWDFHFTSREEYPCPRGTRLLIDEKGNTQHEDIRNAVTLDQINQHGWNSVRVIAKGNHFQFYINGKIASEFTDNATEGRLHSGAIGFQIHDKGMRVEFKDIGLKKLAPAKNTIGMIPVGLQKQLFVDDYVIAEKKTLFAN